MDKRLQLSVPEKLLLAAYKLEGEGHRPFSAENLVVAAWNNFPDTFGLAGYHDEEGRLLYPDSNRVFAEIMGSKPIRNRGLLVKVGNKMYQLTEAGREHARLLLARSDKSSINKAGLAREVQVELKKLLESKAFKKYKNNRLNDLTFHDACSFWGISPRSSAIEFKGRVSNFLGIINAARKAFHKKTVTFEHRGFPYSTNDLKKLLDLHDKMMKKFHTDIEIIEKRIDERKI